MSTMPVSDEKSFEKFQGKADWVVNGHL